MEFACRLKKKGGGRGERGGGHSKVIISCIVVFLRIRN